VVYSKYKPKMIYVEEEEWKLFVAKYESASEKLREFVHKDLAED